VAAALWAAYSFFIGRLGGKAFEDNVWAGLLLSVGITLVISALVEAVRRIRRYRKRRRQRQPEPAEPAEPASDRNRVATPDHSG
jgi:membrane protein DedA with SNARE-associated domain